MIDRDGEATATTEHTPSHTAVQAMRRSVSSAAWRVSRPPSKRRLATSSTGLPNPGTSEGSASARRSGFEGTASARRSGFAGAPRAAPSTTRAAPVSFGASGGISERLMLLSDVEALFGHHVTHDGQVWSRLRWGVLPLAGAGVVGALYAWHNWGEIKQDSVTQLSSVVEDTLESEVVTDSAKQLAAQIVAHLLQDESTRATATAFFAGILNEPKVVEAALRLTNRVLERQATRDSVAALAVKVLDQPSTKNALVRVVSKAYGDGVGKQASINYASAVMTDERTTETMRYMAAKQMQTLLGDPETHAAALDLVRRVIADEELKAEGSEALISIVGGVFWGKKKPKKPEQIEELATLE